MPTVLVGVDGSDDALRAVRWAAAEADRRQLPLRLVHAFSLGRGARLRGAHRRRALPEHVARAGPRSLGSAASAAAEAQPGLAVQQQLIVGYPAEVLAAEARRARLLVLGDRGLSRIEGVLVGSTAAAMAAHAACPIVVVRGAELDQEASRTRPVVVGVDDSASSEAAIGFAFEAAAARKVPLLAVHAYADSVADPMIGKLIDWDVMADEETRRLTAQPGPLGREVPRRRRSADPRPRPAGAPADRPLRDGPAGRRRLTRPTVSSPACCSARSATP